MQLPEPEFEVTPEIKARAKQTVDAFRQLADSQEFLKDDIAGARRVLAGSNEDDKLVLLILFEPLRPIQAAKERGDHVVFKKRFIVIDGKRKARAAIRSAVTTPAPELDAARALLDDAIDEESGLNAALKNNGSEEGA
jgi:hypothetical protein